jgi:hypothetical protein
VADVDLQQIADRVKTVGGGRERGPVGIAIDARPAGLRRGLTYTDLTRKIVDVEVLLTAWQVSAYMSFASARASYRMNSSPRWNHQNVR